MVLPENITIGIIGSGRMGTDIFYYLSDLTYRLVWLCLDAAEQSRIQSEYTRKIERQLRNRLIDEAGLRAKKLNIITCSPADLHDCDIIIEAIHEHAADKARLFVNIEPVIAESAVLVTNSSSIKPSMLIRDEALKKRFAGLHFFYPVQLKNIVELIVTENTDEKTLTLLRDFISSMGKFHLEMHEDDAFILNRLFLDFQALAYRLYKDEGFDMRTLDAIVRKSMFPVGVFEFFDAVGIDVMRESIVNYTENMAEKDFYKPLIDGLDALLSRNRLGRKTGSGFYDYPDDDSAVALPSDETRGRVLALLESMYINTAFRALERKVWFRADLEYAVMEYMGIDRGPFARSDEIGHEAIKDLLQRRYEATGYDVYRPSILL